MGYIQKSWRASQVSQEGKFVAVVAAVENETHNNVRGERGAIG